MEEEKKYREESQKHQQEDKSNNNNWWPIIIELLKIYAPSTENLTSYFTEKKKLEKEIEIAKTNLENNKVILEKEKLEFEYKLKEYELEKEYELRKIYAKYDRTINKIKVVSLFIISLSFLGIVYFKGFTSDLTTLIIIIYFAIYGGSSILTKTKEELKQK